MLPCFSRDKSCFSLTVRYVPFRFLVFNSNLDVDKVSNYRNFIIQMTDFSDIANRVGNQKINPPFRKLGPFCSVSGGITNPIFALFLLLCTGHSVIFFGV